MGIEIERFPSVPFQDFVCSICNGVLEDPRQCKEEHIFCRECITNWITDVSQSCPRCVVGHNQLTLQQLKPVGKVVLSMIHGLNISCDNQRFGCKLVMKLEQLNDHLNDCQFAQFKSIGVQSLDLEESRLKKMKREHDDRIAVLEWNENKKRADLLAKNIELEKQLAESKLKSKEHETNCSKLQLKLDEAHFHVDRLRKEREGLREKLNQSSSTVNPLQSSKSNAIINGFLEHLCTSNQIDSKLLAILNRVNYNRFYVGDEKNLIQNLKIRALAIKNSVLKLKTADKVLNLIECPFFAICLATYSSNCKFVVSHRLKNSIVKNGAEQLIKEGRLVLSMPLASDFDRFEHFGSPEHGPFEVIINDTFFIARMVSEQLVVQGLAFNAITNQVHKTQLSNLQEPKKGLKRTHSETGVY